MESDTRGINGYSSVNNARCKYENRGYCDMHGNGSGIKSEKSCDIGNCNTYDAQSIQRSIELLKERTRAARLQRASLITQFPLRERATNII
jgi:hypothetical protein